MSDDYTITRVDEVEEWTERLLVAVGKTVEAHVELGKELRRAKKAVGHGHFTSMIEERMPFQMTWAQMLMELSDSKRFSKAQRSGISHQSWW